MGRRGQNVADGATCGSWRTVKDAGGAPMHVLGKHEGHGPEPFAKVWATGEWQAWVFARGGWGVEDGNCETVEDGKLAAEASLRLRGVDPRDIKEA